VLLAAAAGWRIEEVSVGYRARIGRSKVTGTVRGTARAVHDMAVALRVGGAQGERLTESSGEPRAIS